jgi:hypothetical protein
MHSSAGENEQPDAAQNMTNCEVLHSGDFEHPASEAINAKQVPDR